MSAEKEDLLKSVQGLMADSEKSLNEKIKGVATSQSVLDLEEKLKGTPTSEDVEEIKKAFTSLEATIGAMKEKEVAKNEDPILKALEDNLGSFQKAFSTKNSSEEVVIKNTIGSIGAFTQGNYLPESPNLVQSSYGGVPRFANENMFNMLDHVTVINATAPNFIWHKINNEEGEAEWLPEEGLKPLADFDIEEKNSGAKKIAIGFKITEEQLKDLPYMKSKIDEYLNKLIIKGLRKSLISGLGGDDLDGYLSMANVFAGGDFAETVQSPTNWDVASTLNNYLSCMDCEGTHMVINCADWSSMTSEKDTLGRYNVPPNVQNGSFAGVQFISAPASVMPKGDFLMYDKSEAKVAVWDALSMRVGYDDGDFRRNRMMFILEGRFLSYAENTCGFVKGNLSDVKDIIAIPEPVVTP